MTPEESRTLWLAEYAALRGEITTFLQLQVQFMSYSITLGTALGGLAIAKRSFEAVAFLPFPFLIFGLL